MLVSFVNGRSFSTFSGVDSKKFTPNLNRRAGNAGLDEQHINDLLSNGKLIIPCNFNLKSENEDDENVSVTISESKFNVVLSNYNMDLNDQLIMKSLHIDEINSTTDSERSKEDDDREKRGSESNHQPNSVQKYCSNSELSDDEHSHNTEDSSSCPELKQLVHSSQNSGVSVGCERNRGSKLSKTSIDVAVQADASEIMTQTAAQKTEEKKKRKNKSKAVKTREAQKNKMEERYKEKKRLEKMKQKKAKYQYCGSDKEKKALK